MYVVKFVSSVRDSFYSLHRETYSVTVSVDSRAFLPLILSRFYSLHRETYSVTLAFVASVATVAIVSIRCIARRTA